MNKMYKESRISVFSRAAFSISTTSSSSYSTDTRKLRNEDSESFSMTTEEDDSFSESILIPEEQNAIKKVIVHEAYCFDVKKFSEKLVEATYKEANKHLNLKKKIITVYDIIVPILHEIINVVIPVDSKAQIPPVNDSWLFNASHSSDISSGVSLDWPKISEFNIKLGLEKLEDYVSTWQGLQDWMFCVEFLGFESEDCSNIFVYEVEWSKPTKTYPIPQATASVYFALEVSKIVPYTYDRSIEISYVFESSSVIHVPGRIDFQEKWLEDILEAKIKFFKTVTFGVPIGVCSSFIHIPISNFL